MKKTRGIPENAEKGPHLWPLQEIMELQLNPFFPQLLHEIQIYLSVLIRSINARVLQFAAFYDHGKGTGCGASNLTHVHKTAPPGKEFGAIF